MDVEVSQLTDSVWLYKVGIVNYYLYKGEKVVLYEAGLSCTASKLLEELDVAPDYLIVPHSHFDHVCGVSLIAEMYPEVKVVAHEKVKGLTSKEKVLKAWASDDLQLCKNYFGVEEEVDVSKIRIDLVVKEKDKVSDIEILETPGHSPDCISAYLRKENVLLVSDSLGFPLSSGKILPMFFYNFDEYYESMKRIEGIKPYVLGLAHNKCLIGGDCDTFIESAISETITVYKTLKSDIDDEEVFRQIYVDEIAKYPEMTMRATAKLLRKRALDSDLTL